MSNQTAPIDSNRRRLITLGGLCGVLALCLCVAGVAGGAYWWTNRSGPTRAEEPAVEYILDASPRMALPAAGAANDATRLAVAQGVLAEIVRPADPEVSAGLRVFGNGALPVPCEDTDLLVPIAPANQGQISDRALALQAGAAADAALAQAMIAAIRDLSDPAGPHTLVVVTGGKDSCNPEAGELIAREAENAGIELQLFVVGYQVPDEELADIKGTVEDGGGTYLGAVTEDELRAILEAIQDYVDNRTDDLRDRILALVTPEALATAVAEVNTTSAAPVNTPEATSVIAETAEATAASDDATAAPVTTPSADYESQTACDHPYLPLRLGATWTYSSEFGGYTWTVTEVSGDLDNATATMVSTFEEGSVSYHWTCTREGIVSYDFGSVAAGTGEAVEFEVVSSEGVWLPPADELVPGASWTNAYTLQMSGAGGGSSSDTHQSFTVAGSESVDSSAGAYEALRIDGVSSVSISVAGASGFNLDGTSTMWLVWGVGFVRADNVSAGTSSSSVLVSYSIP